MYSGWSNGSCSKLAGRSCAGAASAQVTPPRRSRRSAPGSRNGTTMTRRDRRQAGAHGRDLLARVDRLAGVAVAVDRHQHLGLDLPEAVEHALDPEVGRAGRPDGAQARGRQHGDDGLRHVRQVAGHPVADPYALGPQGCRDPRHLGVELGPGELAPAPVLAAEDDGGRAVAAAQQVLGVVQPRVREPARPRHRGRVLEHRLGPAARHHAARVPDLAPERVRLVDRPAPEPGHGVRAGEAVARRHAGDLRRRRALRRGLPKQLAHRSLLLAAARRRTRRVRGCPRPQEG